MQATPSPRSTSEAPEFFFTTPLDFFATSTDHTPAGTFTGFVFAVLRSKYTAARGGLGIVGVPGFLSAPRATSRHLQPPACPSFFMRVDGGLNAGRIPQFERPQLPVEAQAHGAIDLDDGIGNFRNAVGRVVPQIGKRRPQEMRPLCPPSAGCPRGPAACAAARPVSSMFFAMSSAGNFGFCRGRYSSVFQSSARRSSSFAVGRAFTLLVKAALGFVAQPFALQHLLVEVRQRIRSRATRPDRRLLHVADHVPENVEPDQIDRCGRSPTSAIPQRRRSARPLPRCSGPSPASGASR